MKTSSRIKPTTSKSAPHRVGKHLTTARRHISRPAHRSIRGCAISSQRLHIGSPQSIHTRRIATSSQQAQDGPQANDFQLLPAAVKQLRVLNQQHIKANPEQASNQVVGLRLTVDTGGCSGFQYIFDKDVNSNPQFISYLQSTPQSSYPEGLDAATNKSIPQQSIFIQDEDIFFINSQQYVVVDDVSYPFIQNSQFDYRTELIRSGFGVVNNPNVELACGCGTSFSKKAEQHDLDSV